MIDSNNKVLNPDKDGIEMYHSCGHEKTEPHTCPYSEEINGDSEKLCTCCEDCQYQCAQDI